MLVELPELAY